MQQASDFRTEVEALAAIVTPLSDAELKTVTQFKGWTIEDVIGHLHIFDHAAGLALESGDKFIAFFGPILKQMTEGKSLREAQYPWLDGLAGQALVARWQETAHRVADAFSTADPKARLKWAGPDMSALSSITARQMETWAHGHEVFDILGKTRVEGDRIRNICHLGVTTFGWTFLNRKEAVPETPPFVRLTGPSGAVWTWGEESSPVSVEGNAVEFAQVVTQTRSFGDTSLETKGPEAEHWMIHAQCFAGPPETPPAKGQRHQVV